VGIEALRCAAFALLDGILSLVALITTTIVLIAQNRQAKLEQQHTHLALQVNLLTEQKVTKLIDLIGGAETGSADGQGPPRCAGNGHAATRRHRSGGVRHRGSGPHARLAGIEAGQAKSGEMTGAVAWSLCPLDSRPSSVGADVSIFHMEAKLSERLIEKRSIDYVPIAERHGKVWHLWPVWFSGDAHLATVATGVVGIALGGNLVWMAIAVTLGSALGTFFMAFHSTQGPQLGLPQMINHDPVRLPRRHVGLGGGARLLHRLQRVQSNSGRADDA